MTQGWISFVHSGPQLQTRELLPPLENKSNAIIFCVSSLLSQLRGVQQESLLGDADMCSWYGTDPRINLQENKSLNPSRL